MDRHNLGKTMTQDQQETLNEIFLGKEDPDMAFKPMTNNLKEIEDILDFTITYRFYDEVPNIQGKLLEFRGKITEEASERILTLINQKEKELLEKFGRAIEGSYEVIVEDNKVMSQVLPSDPNWVSMFTVDKAFKQLKEELNKEVTE